MARWSLLAVLLTFAPGGAFAASLRLAVLSVGQGDAIAVVSPSGCAALIDAGPRGSGRTIQRFLRSQGVTRIDFAIVSHYHRDHIAGLEEVEAGADRLPIEVVYDRGGSYRTQTYDAYASWFGGRRQTVAPGDRLSLCGEVAFQVVAADGNGINTQQENARSVAVKIEYGELDVFAGGDLTGDTPDVESRIAAQVGPVEIYKVSHHCSNTSSRAPLLRAIRPAVALISVGKGNAYGHPVQGCLGRLRDHGAEIWQTAGGARGSGDIVVVSDGRTYEVKQGPALVHHQTAP